MPRGVTAIQACIDREVDVLCVGVSAGLVNGLGCVPVLNCLSNVKSSTVGEVGSGV